MNTMKKIFGLVLAINLIFALWVYFAPHTASHKEKLDIFCESTLKLSTNRDNENVPFHFSGTVLVRFKPDSTGYIGLSGDAEYNGTTYYVAREVGFQYQPKDTNNILSIKLNAQHIAARDNTPTQLIENNITGKPNADLVYIVRRANSNTYSIGNMYSPIIMCVDKS